MQRNTRIMMEGTIIAALCMALSFIPTTIGTSFTVSLGQIPLTIFALRRGFRPAFIAGFIWGILHILLGQAYILTFWQGLIEYVIAFPFAAFAGLYAGKVQQQLRNRELGRASFTAVVAAIVGALTRFFWHFVAGFIFWGAYAMWGLNPFWFSFVTQGISGLGTGVVCAVVAVLVVRTYPKLLLPQE